MPVLCVGPNIVCSRARKQGPLPAGMFTLTTTAAGEEEEAFPEFFGLVSCVKKGRTSACGHVNRYLSGGTLYDTQDVPAIANSLWGTSDYVPVCCPFRFDGQNVVGIAKNRPQNSGEFWSTISVLALRIAPQLLEYLEIQ